MSVSRETFVPPALVHLTKQLDALQVSHQLRERSEPLDDVVSFCSNDYLGLARTGGAGASRLVAGERRAHRQLEQTLASWLKVEQTLLFSSGYAANVGVLTSLIGETDRVVSDQLNHASIIDGLRLTRADVVVTPHLDIASMHRAISERRGSRAWVVTETYFSMDADTPPLAALRRLCNEHDAGLIVDEAHALGVFGPDGRGLCARDGVVPDVLVGTLGKALGVGGAFVAGCEPLIRWLWTRARSHVYSTGLSPLLASAARANLLEALENPALRTGAIGLGARFREEMKALGANVKGHGPIVPWVLGSEEAALDAAAAFRSAGIHVVAIRPPTVPSGGSRLRFTFTARHTAEDIERLLAVARHVMECLPSSS